MGDTFRKEQRYVVLKIKDIIAAGLTPDEVEAFNKVCDKVSLHRNQAGKPPLGCVVVEADWRCYDTVWGLVEQEHRQNEATKECAEKGHNFKLMQVAGDGETCQRCGLWRGE